MLACARIGAIHTIVFGGFSAEALRDRILDAGATMLVTANGYWRSGKHVSSKASADTACDLCEKQGHKVQNVIVVKRLDGFDVPMKAGRDTFWGDEMAASDISDTCPAGADGCGRSPVHPLHLGLHGQAEGRHAHGRRLHGLRVQHLQIHLRLQGQGHLLLHRRHRLGHGPLLHRVRSALERRHLHRLRIRPYLPAARPVLADHREVQGQHLLHRADRDQGHREGRRAVAGEEGPLLPEAPRLGGRADQPRGMDVVSQEHRQGKMPHRRYLVADRDGRHPHHAPSRRMADQARLGDAAVLRRRCGRVEAEKLRVRSARSKQG